MSVKPVLRALPVFKTFPVAMFGVPPLFLLVLTVQSAFSIWWYPVAAHPSCSADTLLVMGAAQYDGTPSPAFARRLDKALDLFEQGCAERIVVTGGKQAGDRFTEGDAGAAYLAARGVAKADLLAETESRSSFQNLKLSLPYVQHDRLLIVTDDMHAYRTQWLAAHLGLDASVAPVETGPLRLGYGVRELVGLIAYTFGVFR